MRHLAAAPIGMTNRTVRLARPLLAITVLRHGFFHKKLSKWS
jgi:hypothetical protein